MKHSALENLYNEAMENLADPSGEARIEGLIDLIDADALINILKQPDSPDSAIWLEITHELIVRLQHLQSYERRREVGTRSCLWMDKIK